jgi:hypothetical protein
MLSALITGKLQFSHKRFSPRSQAKAWGVFTRRPSIHHYNISQQEVVKES